MILWFDIDFCRVFEHVFEVKPVILLIWNQFLIKCSPISIWEDGSISASILFRWVESPGNVSCLSCLGSFTVNVGKYTIPGCVWDKEYHNITHISYFKGENHSAIGLIGFSNLKRTKTLGILSYWVGSKDTIPFEKGCNRIVQKPTSTKQVFLHCVFLKHEIPIPKGISYKKGLQASRKNPSRIMLIQFLLVVSTHLKNII